MRGNINATVALSLGVVDSDGGDGDVISSLSGGFESASAVSLGSLKINIIIIASVSYFSSLTLGRK